MSWQFLIGISIILEAVGRIMQRVLMKDKDSDPVPVVVVYQMAAGILLYIVTILLRIEIPDVSPYVFNLFLTPILWGTANFFVFKSLKSTEASVFTVLFTTRTIWVILLSIFLLGDIFSLRQVFGALLILAAVILVSFKKKTISFGRGEIFALIAAVFMALGIINDYYLVNSLPVVPYLAYNFFFSGVVVWLINIKATKSVMAFVKNPTNLSKASLLAIIYPGAAVTYLLAYQVGKNAAQLGAIYPLSNILVVILAIILLNEKTGMVKKLLAVAVSVIGVILVS